MTPEIEPVEAGEAEARADALQLLVASRKEVAQGIWLYELRSLHGDELPPFEPGAHLLVRTPAGLLRRYSICSSTSDRSCYQIGVKHEPGGGGGSTSMVEDLREGDILPMSLPVNYFPPDPTAGLSLLIAGGIGITPILSMARHLREQGAPFRLVYCARSAEAAAFVDVLAAPDLADRTVIHYDDGDPARALDLGAHLAEHPPGAHLYCCGPRALMQGVREAAKHWPPGTVHFEDFGTSAHPGTVGESRFRVRLARSGEVLTVEPDESILAALRRHGVEVPFSCEAGTCGSCRTGLLAGVAEHRDFVLQDDEHDSAIMICVSRALSEELTLDV
ncbi:MAG TPA: PDR/VanB family oxidoreductase [Aliidongia sp.]|nr:PDR/VanB family oxidoreductase [Aliidongia sp.]